jgi:hypothetical protein
MTANGTGERIAGGTGHRPRGIPAANLPWVREQAQAVAVWLRDQGGVTIGISGMADGFDLIWADAIVTAGMRLWTAIPFLEQPERFPNPADRDEWARLRALTEPGRERVFGSIAGLEGAARGARINQLLWARNAGIIGPADFLVCCWDPRRTTRCGTYNAITMAHARGHPARAAVNINPISAHVDRGLPALAEASQGGS